LVGYYFNITKVNENINNNLSYITQKYKSRDRNNLTKYKKCQCKFISEEDRFSVNNNNNNNSFAIKPPNNKNKNYIKKLGHKEKI